MKLRVPFTLAVAVLLSVVVGCDPNRASNSEQQKPAAPATSNVPLRLWIVGEVSDAKLVERAWLTGSDQPLEIRTLTVAEFLAEKSCACDVVVYPSRLVGELLDRKWLTKLPATLSAPVEDAPQVPAGWHRQAVYGTDTWAVPLGASVPMVVVSPPAVEALATVADWDDLLKSLAIEETKKAESAFDKSKVDRVALVDRFLAIAGSLSERTPDYGLLFVLQTMKPRLTEPEFLRAAEILVRLTQQKSSGENGSVDSVVADDSSAWAWVQSQTVPAVTVVSPSRLSAEAMKATGGKAIRVPAKAIGWNTGSGLNASLSMNCRQSARATELLTWLRSSETRQTLATLIRGIETASPLAGSDSTAWQATSLSAELTSNGTMPNELRLPRTEDYRAALAESLVTVVSGEKSAKEALEAAADAWQKITEAQGRVLQRSEYERSLGLVRE